KVWDLATGTAVFDREFPRGRALALGPDGKTIATASSEGIQLYEVDTGRAILPPGRRITGESVAFSPDGQRFLSGRPDKDFVKLHDARTGEVAFTLRGVTAGVGSVAFSPDGHKILAISRQGGS